MKQVRIGVIGVGGRGVLASAWHKPGGNSVVIAGADVSTTNLDKFKQELNPDAFTTQNYLTLLDSR